MKSIGQVVVNINISDLPPLAHHHNLHTLCGLYPLVTKYNTLTQFLPVGLNIFWL